MPLLLDRSLCGTHTFMAPHKNPRRDSLIAWIDAKQLRKSDVARMANIPYTTLDSFIKGKTAEMMGTTEQRIADAFAAPVEDIFVHGGKNSPVHDLAINDESVYKIPAKRVGILPREGAYIPQKPRMVPVVGNVQAGAFTEVHQFDFVDENTEFLPFYDPQYDRATVLALTVVGNSCDLIYPAGTKIFVVPASEAGVRIGDLVIVQQIDITGRAETTMKEVTVVDGAVILQPRSTDKTQRPIPYKRRDEASQDGPEIKFVVKSSLQRAPSGQGPLLRV